MRCLILFLIVIFISCGGSRNLSKNIDKKNLPGDPSTHKSYQDASLYINNKYALLIARKQEYGKIFYTNPRIYSDGTIIKLNVFFNTTDITDLTTSVSPNNSFMVMSYIADNGYVYLSDSDSVYHEVFKCSMFSLKTGKTLKEELTPIESGGNWNEMSKWVDQDGKVLIDPLKL